MLNDECMLYGIRKIVILKVQSRKVHNAACFFVLPESISLRYTLSEGLTQDSVFV